MSSPDINYPEQPSYGEGMAEALKAQAEFLRGTGDFADVGSLESLLPLEESIRKKTAQTDTDILRQTLLGRGGDEKYAPDGRIIVGYDDPPRSETGEGGLKVVQEVMHVDRNTVRATTKVIDTATGKLVEENEEFADHSSPWIQPPPGSDYPFPTSQAIDDKTQWQTRSAEDIKGDSLGKLTSISSEQAQTFLNADYPDSLIFDQEGGVSESTPIYKKDETGADIVVPEGSFTPGQSVGRRGDGMVDILGDTRDLTQFETRTATQADVDAGLADEVGDSFVETIQTDDQAGFREGEFKGLATMAEDIQRGSLSRQREADLQDVSRLSGLYQDIMGDYKPGTQSAITGAKNLIEEQKLNLLKDVGITDPEKVASEDVAAGTLRSDLITQAQSALKAELTDRERREIAEAARARSTLMGRTFDQSSAIQEAEARVLEDNQRKMQNRAFAQSVLGQEAGIQTADDQRAMGADQFNVGTKMDAERLRESLRMQGLLGYLDAASRIQQIEDRDSLDPFQAILGRGGGTALQQGQSVFGQAGYGLQSSPQYLNPEAGLGFIQNQATNAANMAIADQQSRAMSQAGVFQGLGSLGSGLLSNPKIFKCWVAREVYGAHNPAWLLFRNWLDTKAPRWFDKLYLKFGERFAKFISNKPRLKARIRIWMDSKIRR